MPSILFSNIHNTLFDEMCYMFTVLGWKVYIPSQQEPNYFGYGSTILPNKGTYTCATYQEIIDIKPDVVLCQCLEQYAGAAMVAQNTKSKLVLYAGNNYVPYNKAHANYLIATDINTYTHTDIPNKLFFYVPPNYDIYKKGVWDSNSTLVTSFIHHYQKYWGESWEIYTGIKELNPDVSFINYGACESNNNSLILYDQNVIYKEMCNSRCVLHIKQAEGYGFSIIEAIASGIPIFACRDYVLGKTCEHFLLDGVTAVLLGKNPGEFRAAFDNVELLKNIAETGPKKIRELINPEEQYSKIKKFFEEVVL